MSAHAALRRTCAATVVLFLTGRFLHSAAKPVDFARPLNAFDSAAVERARAGAVRRLQGPECAKVLGDFTDRDGRTLEQNLDPWGMSAAAYLGTLRFWDGSTVPHCDLPSVQLVTMPGLLPVYLCPGKGVPRSKLAAVQVVDPALAEFMIIHEMLHTLGLGENPPSTFEITARVRKRCQ